MSFTAWWDIRDNPLPTPDTLLFAIRTPRRKRRGWPITKAVNGLRPDYAQVLQYLRLRESHVVYGVVSGWKCFIYCCLHMVFKFTQELFFTFFIIN